MNSESKELPIFRHYCEIRKLDIERVEEQPPPQPDILAVVSGQGIAYELTEAVDPVHMRKLCDALKTPELVRKSVASLPSGKKRQLESNHYGKMITVCFHDGVTLRDREKSLPEVFDLLISIPADFGLNHLATKRNPMAVLEYIEMQQVDWRGIWWESGAVYNWIDPENDLFNRLIDKMENKRYRSAHPIELIVYLERQVDPVPGSRWLERLANVASERISFSPFRAVWLLNMWTISVCLLAGPKLR